MRRRATILDVLREAQDRGREAALSSPETAPGEAAPDELPPAAPVSDRAERSRAAARFAGAGAWLRGPASLTRLAVLVVGLAGVFALAAAFALGVEKGRNTARAGLVAGGGSSGKLGRQPRRRGVPARMHETGTGDPGRTRPASDERGPATRRLVGFRIVTYNDTVKNRELARAMRRHLAAGLAGTGARDEWALDGDKLLVAVAFPEDRVEDEVWQAALFDRIRRLPPPKWGKGFDFSKLAKQVVRRRLK